MLNMNPGLWPQWMADSADAEGSDPWGLSSVIETQARLWNHLLDANRSLWEFYAPWFASGPSLWNAALTTQRREEAVTEPEQSVDGMPDAFETQARSWNHFLDANRTLWSAFTWPVAAAPWLNATDVAAASSDEAVTPVPRPRAAKQATARKSTRRTRSA